MMKRYTEENLFKLIRYTENKCKNGNGIIQNIKNMNKQK